MQVKVNLRSRSKNAKSEKSEPALLAIGEIVKRSGVAASTLRYYEDENLIASVRLGGSRRHYRRDVLRRIAFIRAAQKVGLTLDEIRSCLVALPDQRTPTAADWARLSKSWGPLLDERIRSLVVLRDKLNGCIGCGCLSLRACALFNPADEAGCSGGGAKFLL